MAQRVGRYASVETRGITGEPLHLQDGAHRLAAIADMSITFADAAFQRGPECRRHRHDRPKLLVLLAAGWIEIEQMVSNCAGLASRIAAGRARVLEPITKNVSMWRERAASMRRAISRGETGHPMGSRPHFWSAAKNPNMCGTSLNSCHLCARFSAARPTDRIRSMPLGSVPRRASHLRKRSCSRGVSSATVFPVQNSCQ